MFESNNPPLKASVVITTKNRKQELRTALDSALAQAAQPEVIVIDDGSTDGTSEMVRQEFPQVALHNFEKSEGLISRRNEGTRLAKGDVIFSIDDDAAFSTPYVVAQTLAEFDSPQIGAVAIPYINVRKDGILRQKAPDTNTVWAADSFVGTAHAVRREVFLQLGGYREQLIHQGEESDLCLRLLNAGYVVRLGNADPIHHLESPNRDLRRMDFYGCRNSILFAWQNVPTAFLPVHLAATTFNCLRWTFDPRRFLTRLRGIGVGYRDCFRFNRAPVRTEVYQHWRTLKKGGAIRLKPICVDSGEPVMPCKNGTPAFLISSSLPPSALPVAISIMITTRNRSSELKRTCGILKRLAPAPLEILITADGCTDDTVELVKSELPNARLIVNETGRGSVASRDRMMREARGDLVLALDDDSYPEQLDCFARFVPLFEQNPKLAVVHFPQHTDEFPETLTQADFGLTHPTRSFANSGAVLRRSTYLQLPGFEPKYFHAYEEPDYALQCMAAGHEVFFAPVVTIRHHYSGRNRNELLIHQRHSRNEFWSTLIRCPFPYVIGIAAYRVLSQFRYACTRGFGWVIREPVWWWEALKGIPYCLKRRNPVGWLRYKAWLRLGYK